MRLASGDASTLAQSQSHPTAATQQLYGGSEIDNRQYSQSFVGDDVYTQQRQMHPEEGNDAADYVEQQGDPELMLRQASNVSKVSNLSQTSNQRQPNNRYEGGEISNGHSVYDPVTEGLNGEGNAGGSAAGLGISGPQGSHNSLVENSALPPSQDAEDPEGHQQQVSEPMGPTESQENTKSSMNRRKYNSNNFNSNMNSNRHSYKHNNRAIIAIT